MKLSERTLALLKNFSNINNMIYVKEGSTLKTISVTQNIFARANVPEDFAMPFAIYDLHELLVGLSVWQQPDLEFNNTSYLTISSGRSKVKYFLSDPAVVQPHPPESIGSLDYKFAFDLERDEFENLKKLAGIYNLPDLCVETNAEGEVALVIKDKENDTSNTVIHTVGHSDTQFSFQFKVENLKMISTSYHVKLATKAAHFVDNDLEYFIALEPDSFFG
jgi:hypothetical protein